MSAYRGADAARRVVMDYAEYRINGAAKWEPMHKPDAARRKR